MKLTHPQRKILQAVADDQENAAWASKGSPVVMRRMMACGMVRWNRERKCGRELTEAGAKALQE